MYGAGLMEETFGKIVKELGVSRETLVVTTKLWTSNDPELNSTSNTNCKHVHEGIKQSLKRLQMDYVDIAIAHNYDSHTPLEEICRSFNEIIEEGQAFYWAVSNWSAINVFEAFAICEKKNWHKPIAIQNEYNMVHRAEIESEFRTLFANYKLGLMAYSPLLGGILTGKYLENGKEVGRLTNESTEHLKKELFHALSFKNYS